MPKITIDQADLQEIIKDSIKTSLLEVGSLPACRIEGIRMSALEARLDKALIVLVGNGNPEHGLVFKFGIIEKDVRRITAGIWAFMIIGLGLFVTAAWNIILSSK